jgi:uncharacterized protein YcsI (UPF0317 family)
VVSKEDLLESIAKKWGYDNLDEMINDSEGKCFTYKDMYDAIAIAKEKMDKKHRSVLFFNNNRLEMTGRIKAEILKSERKIKDKQMFVWDGEKNCYSRYDIFKKIEKLG